MNFLPAAAFPGGTVSSGSTGITKSGYPTQGASSSREHSPFTAQKLKDLSDAFDTFEGFDEAGSVNQVQLSCRMQSNLQNLLDDTPREAAAASALPRRKVSLVSRSMEMGCDDFGQPPAGWSGPTLEHNEKVSMAFCMSLVRHFQQSPNKALPARYVCRLVQEAEKIMDDRGLREGSVWNAKIPDTGMLSPNQQEHRLIIMGDTHGQLEDVLFVFYKMGVPTPANRYLINGDICDRGPRAVEIWALLLAFMCYSPESVIIHRGNHEDRTMNMDGSCGGFYEELLQKYGRYDGVGALLYEKFGRLFSRLPLASIVDDRIFVVHGGLSRTRKGFLRMLRSCRVRKAEVPESSAHASAQDLAFVDSMWADPHELPGVAINPRGAGLIVFGPDVTDQFLEENNLELIIRSHQLPEGRGGYSFSHNGRLITVFSASNYCGVCDNQGSVVMCKLDGSCEIVQHFAPSFDQLARLHIEQPDSMEEQTPANVRVVNAERRKSDAEEIQKIALEAAMRDAVNRTEKLENEVVWKAARMVVERKQSLFEYWRECDISKPSGFTGFISIDEWAEGMAVVLGDSLPWPTLGRVLRVGDDLSKDVDYRSFINRFRVTIVGGLSGGCRWLEEMLGRFYGRLLTLKGDAGSLSEIEGFLGHGAGEVSQEGACEVFQWVLGNTLTEDQANAMLRTLAAHATSDPSPANSTMDVWGFLSRLDVCYQHNMTVSQGVTMAAQDGCSVKEPPSQAKPEASPWVRSVLTHVGRLLWMEDSHGSPKAGGHRMLQVFRRYDENNDGLLERAEFAKAVRHLLREHGKQLPPSITEASATTQNLNDLIEFVDVSKDGIVNYLEFLHAFQPVDRTPGRGLRMDLMEQICTTIWANKPSLLRTLQVCEETLEQSSCGEFKGCVHSDNLKRTLRSLNASLGGSNRGAPLTNHQIDILVDHAECDELGRLNYQKFLDAIQIVDTDPPRPRPEDRTASDSAVRNRSSSPSATGPRKTSQRGAPTTPTRSASPPKRWS